MSLIHQVEAGAHVIRFMRERLATDPVFHIQELVDYVYDRQESVPVSLKRILQLLRRKGYYDYEVIDRWGSPYQVTAVYDTPRPKKTRPKVHPVIEMCEMLMDSKVNLEDKHAVFMALGDALFPGEFCPAPAEMSQQFITKGVPKLEKAEDVSVCLTPGFKRCYLSVLRDGDCEIYSISKRVAAELIAAGFAYQG